MLAASGRLWRSLLPAVSSAEDIWVGLGCVLLQNRDIRVREEPHSSGETQGSCFWQCDLCPETDPLRGWRD